MRVAVNLTWLVPGRVGGSEEYLTRQLQGVDPGEFDLELFGVPELRRRHPGLVAHRDLRTMPAARGGRAARIAMEHTWLAVRTRGADLVHHGGGTAPAIGSSPYVLTIHDLQYRTFPEYFSAPRLRYLSVMTPRSARSAAVIAVPTQTVRGAVLDAFDVASDRVVVVPHGVPDLERPTDGQLADVRQRLGLGDAPYVVYPAVTHPHKGHRVLVDMLSDLPDDTHLVLIGGVGAAESAIRQRMAANPEGARVLRPGRVTDSDRNALIAGADALVFPSEFEGFGAPVVEAMALDTPVVCSSADALVEVVADAAVVVDDQVGSAWAAGVQRARTRRAELIAAGRLRRDSFTIDAAGVAISDVYRRAAS